MIKLILSIVFTFYSTIIFADNKIIEAQKLLNKLNLNAGLIDGRWGKKTENAIKRFYYEIGSNFDGQIDQKEIADLKTASLTYRNFGNKDWAPEIRTKLHDITSPKANFSYINQDLISALTRFQLEKSSVPNLGFHPVGDPPNVKWVKKPMDMDCKLVLKNMEPPDMSRWDAPLYAQNCNYYYRQRLFSGGINDLQEIFNYWSSQPMGTYDLQPNGDDEYFKSTLMASLITTYALFYEKFSNNDKIDRLFFDWLINNQTLIGKKVCPFIAPETFTPEIYIVDSCGSNHWRLAVANYALGLRIGKKQLLITGAKHLEINLSMYDENGIFTPYATRGWDSPGYAIDNNEYITSIALMLSEININLYDIKIHDGRKIRTLIKGHNAWLTDPFLAKKYIIGSKTCNGGICTKSKSLEDFGTLEQWKIDRQFESFDIALRSFHYETTENDIDPIDLVKQYPIDRSNNLPPLYVWGQTSSFPFIFATLESLGLLNKYLNPPQENLLGNNITNVNKNLSFAPGTAVYERAKNKRFINKVGPATFWIGFWDKYMLDQKMPIHAEININGDITLSKTTSMLNQSVGDLIGNINNDFVSFDFSGIRCDDCDYENVNLIGNINDSFLASSDNHKFTYIIIQK